MAGQTKKEHKMDEALRQKLLNRLPFNRDVTIDYTPRPYLTKELDAEGKETDEYEIPEDYRPVFKCRPFSVAEKQRVSLGKKEEKELLEITRANILGVEKLYDAGTMDLISYKADPKGGMDRDLFDSLPTMVIRDLFVFISSISGLSPYERSGL